MKQQTKLNNQQRQARLMEHDAPNTLHPLGNCGDREWQRITDLGEVVSILAHQCVGENDLKGGDDE